MLDELIEILTKQNQIIITLKELANKQFQALQHEDVVLVSSITGEQELKGRELALLEKQRIELLNSGFQINGKEHIGADITEISELLGFEQKKAWEELIKEIKKNHHELTEIHRMNMSLLKQGLKYSEKMLYFLNKTSINTYGSSGLIQHMGSESNLDRNI